MKAIEKLRRQLVGPNGRARYGAVPALSKACKPRIPEQTIRNWLFRGMVPDDAVEKLKIAARALDWDAGWLLDDELGWPPVQAGQAVTTARRAVGPEFEPVMSCLNDPELRYRLLEHARLLLAARSSGSSMQRRSGVTRK